MTPMSQPVTVGRRRFTCLSPTLVRMEFAPDGRFEQRPSIVAAAQPQAQPFAVVRASGGETTLETGVITIVSRDSARAFSRTTLEVRWRAGRFLQYWRPGDRDPRNLGGTLRSLDRYGQSIRMEGVHTADMESPDAKALTWLAWLQCEDDPPFYEAARVRRPPPVAEKGAAGQPQPPGDPRPPVAHEVNAGDWHRFAQQRDHEGRLLERTLNHTIDAHRFAAGLLSRSGYFFLNDSTSAVLGEDGFPVERDRPGCQDWYFFAYGDDYAQALRDFILLCGPAPLPSRNTFGLFFSRWPAYDENEAMGLVAAFAERGYPLSVLVVDMEWHREGWGHWDWNDAWYPDPPRFFQWCHARGVQVTLNDHPLDVRSDDSHFEPYLEAAGSRSRVADKSYGGRTLPMVDINICAGREARAFSRLCHRPILDEGLDFWWNDGCRGELAGTTGQLVCNKLCFEEAERDGRRGMLLARYGGLGSHRYGATFTGDTESCWEILALECEHTIRAGHVGLAYVSHDIGGFYTRRKADRIDTALYLRWLQFGVFSPVLRFHSAPGSGSRQPWDYDEAAGGAARRWLRVRNSLLPYVYSAAREHHETGMPLVRGLFLNDPANPASYRYDEYLFGPDLLVAPVLGPECRRRLYLPPGEWVPFEGNGAVPGGTEFEREAGLGDVPVYVRAGAILPRQAPDGVLHAGHLAELVLDVYPGAAGSCVLYEDDGLSTGYQRREYCKTRFALAATADGLAVSSAVATGRPLGEMRTVRLRVYTGCGLRRLVLDGTEAPDVPVRRVGAALEVVLPQRPSADPWQVILALA